MSVSKRITPILAVLLLVSSGSTIGFLLGRHHVQVATYEELLEEADKEDGPFLELLDEVTARLPKLSSNPDKVCSNAEHVILQKIPIGSRTLKDAGWLKDGKITCSEVYSRKQLDFSLPAPNLTRADGLILIHNPFHGRPPFDTNKFRVFMFQMGDAYIVGAADHFNRPKKGRLVEIESTLYDVVSHQRKRPSASPILHPNAVLNRDWRGSLGNLVYVTVCRPKEQVCTSAFEPLSVALGKNSDLLIVVTTLGGTFGFILAILGIMLNQRRGRLKFQLRRAIQHRKFQMVYQPIVDLASGRVVEAEALLRWKDKQGELLPTDVLVQIATKHGFMFELTEQVIGRVLEEMGAYLKASPQFSVNINLSVSDLEDARFLPMVDRLIAEAGISPQSLAFEITEGSTARKDQVKGVICELRSRGISIKIDDFGTGYSSLAYLKELCVDAIKIDKAFTQTIGTDSVTVVILPQIIQIAKELNLRAIAEGIETKEQAQFYLDNGEGIYGQGWLFGRPAPVEEFLLSHAVEYEPFNIPHDVDIVP